jgi:hypothetical protein
MSDIFTAMKIRIVISVITCCGLVKNPEDGGNIFFRTLVPTYPVGLTIGNFNTERSGPLILIVEINDVKKVCIPFNK